MNKKGNRGQGVMDEYNLAGEVSSETSCGGKLSASLEALKVDTENGKHKMNVVCAWAIILYIAAFIVAIVALCKAVPTKNETAIWTCVILLAVLMLSFFLVYRVVAGVRDADARLSKLCEFVKLISSTPAVDENTSKLIEERVSGIEQEIARLRELLKTVFDSQRDEISSKIEKLQKELDYYK